MATADAGDARTVAGSYSTSFLRRFWAWCVDTPIRIVIGFAAVFLPMRMIVFSEAEKYGSTDARYLWNVMSSAEKATVAMLWLLASVVIPWLYTALQECSKSQATIGKRLLNLQVTDLEGRRISFARSSGRFFGRLIPTLGIGFCMALFTRRKQALHDVISGCLVIHPAVKTTAPSAG